LLPASVPNPVRKLPSPHSASQEPNGSIPLFLQLPGSTEPQLLRVQGSDYPGDIKKAIITEFKQRFKGVDPDQLVLKLEGSDKALEPMQTLAEAGLLTGGTVKVVVELKAAVPVAGAGVWKWCR